MAFNFIEQVMCCFCGNAINLDDAVILSIMPSLEAEEAQTLFCHKHHLLERLDKSVVLHPDFYA
jgi:oligoribonuclease (3'-5' exoribonuclease)